MIINVAQSSINYLLVHYLSYCEIRSVFSFELLNHMSCTINTISLEQLS